MPALPSDAEAATILPQDPPTTLNVYTTLVLAAENAAVKAHNKMRLVQSRVVGYLMLYPPSSEALRTVTMEVDSCNSPGQSDPHQAIYNLGAMYLSHLIILCVSQGFFSLVSDR